MRGGRRHGASSARARGWLAQLIESHDFSLVFQPIFDLNDGSLFAAEALVRFSPWSSKPPDAVIAQAHQLGLGVELEVAIVEAAIAHIDEIPADALLAVNGGALALASGGIRQALADGEPSKLIVELTEQVGRDGQPQLADVLARMHADGVRVAIDDPGAQLAVMADPVGLAPDFIKADRAAAGASVDEAAQAAGDQALLQRARARGASIIAERIETDAALAAVHKLGIRYGQGFHLAHPAQASELQEAVRRGGTRVSASRRRADPSARS